ncbi:MAG: alpha/beta hydrolase [Clostridia bacterium]|nr:alpha/beta hydrolase [Clostridia bacterium]
MPVINSGAGKDVLFLHGYLSNKESFYYQIKFLSQYFRVTAPDIIGFGGAARLDKAYSLDDYCAWLERFIKEAGIEKPHIIAHSFGARMALKYLSANPEAAEKLVITGGAGLVKPRSKEYIRKVKAYRRVKRFFPKFAEKHFGSAEYRTLSPVMRESYKKIVNEDLKSCAEKIQNQTLLIYGDKDTTTPWNEEGKTFNSLIKGSRLEIIEGGHFCFSESAEAFNKLIYEFLI